MRNGIPLLLHELGELAHVAWGRIVVRGWTSRFGTNVLQLLLYYSLLLLLVRSDITAMADWALKINYLSIYLSTSIGMFPLPTEHRIL